MFYKIWFGNILVDKILLDRVLFGKTVFVNIMFVTIMFVKIVSDSILFDKILFVEILFGKMDVSRPTKSMTSKRHDARPLLCCQLGVFWPSARKSIFPGSESQGLRKDMMLDLIFLTVGHLMAQCQKNRCLRPQKINDL